MLLVYGVFPLYLLHAVRVVGHVLADLDLVEGVPVAPVGSVKFLHQVHQCPELQGLEHEVLPPAHAQRAETSPTVNSQHDMWLRVGFTSNEPLRHSQTFAYCACAARKRMSSAVTNAAFRCRSRD
ncbi:hypothetical protein INR49_032587, partial [Caranx melampygus]